MKIKFRSGDNLGDDESLGAVEQIGESMADQSFKDECDINGLMKRFGITGQILGVEKPPALEEFGEIFDFRSAMDTINAANRAFMTLDAETRARFLNDPQRYVEFCSARDDKGELVNYDEMLKMGLANPKPVIVDPPPVRVEVINQPKAV